MPVEPTYHASEREAFAIDRPPTTRLHERAQSERHQQAFLDQKMKFVAKHPEYGYGYASNPDSSSHQQQHPMVPSRILAPEQKHDETPHGGIQKLVVDSIREKDFPHLLQQHGSSGLVYLDHAGATLYGASQLREATESLLKTVHGNPHSQVLHLMLCYGRRCCLRCTGSTR